MLKKHKKYRKPRKPFDKQRIEEENVLVKKYGLKVKKEIWKAKGRIGKIRDQAKKLITSNQEEQKLFLQKSIKLGLIKQGAEIDDALGLNEEDWLKRRLQTVLGNLGLAETLKGARQLITHKHVTINGKVVNVPSYIVSLEEEKQIKIKKKKKKEKKAVISEKIEGTEESQEKPLTQETPEQLTKTKGEAK